MRLAGLPPCGGDARQGRGGVSPPSPLNLVAPPPLSPPVTSPPQGGEGVAAQASPPFTETP
ncbi:hypothetical protein F4V89_06715 [Neorhizobium galegae]|nr:hypothetical protein F4V88_19400 [Neorhizobium galegae]KAB1114805.1 hypothetical protein F4V89_06715 [Neorhizobium galegae]